MLLVLSGGLLTSELIGLFGQNRKTVIQNYLSSEMANKLMMLAVQHMTSVEIQRLQYSLPNFHSPRRSLTMANGMTSVDKRRSATAKEMKNKLESCKVDNRCCQLPLIAHIELSAR